MKEEVRPSVGGHQSSSERALNHSWRYFEVHAGQRMSLFNFFLALSGLVAAGLAASFQRDSELAELRFVFGALLTIIAIIFWKLDQRVSFLVKHSEQAIAALELAANFPEYARLFEQESRALLTRNNELAYYREVWTLGHSFRWVFAIMGIVGSAAMLLTLPRFLRSFLC